MALFFISNERKSARNIKVSGNNITLTINNKDISARLAEKSTQSFLVDSGYMTSSNTGEFIIIPIEKAKSLEQSYPDFLNCNSFDNIEGYKNNLILVEFIATNETAKKEMREATDIYKGVIEISGSRLLIPGQKENPDSGLPAVFSKNPGIYYLIDDFQVNDRWYQKSKNY